MDFEHVERLTGYNPIGGVHDDGLHSNASVPDGRRAVWRIHTLHSQPTERAFVFGVQCIIIELDLFQADNLIDDQAAFQPFFATGLTSSSMNFSRVVLRTLK